MRLRERNMWRTYNTSIAPWNISIRTGEQIPQLIVDAIALTPSAVGDQRRGMIISMKRGLFFLTAVGPTGPQSPRRRPVEAAQPALFALGCRAPEPRASFR